VPSARFALLRREWPLAVGALSTGLFLAFGRGWLAELDAPGWFALLFGWLFAAIAACAFGVVRHAESLAVRVGEPLGTLVLTLAMSGMELLIIGAVMVAGPGVSSLARDTMLAIVMIV
jgi:Ca2+:H+ antiporter